MEITTEQKILTLYKMLAILESTPHARARGLCTAYHDAVYPDSPPLYKIEKLLKNLGYVEPVIEMIYTDLGWWYAPTNINIRIKLTKALIQHYEETEDIGIDTSDLARIAGLRQYLRSTEKRMLTVLSETNRYTTNATTLATHNGAYRIRTGEDLISKIDLPEYTAKSKLTILATDIEVSESILEDLAFDLEDDLDNLEESSNSNQAEYLRHAQGLIAKLQAQISDTQELLKYVLKLKIYEDE